MGGEGEGDVSVGRKDAWAVREGPKAEFFNYVHAKIKMQHEHQRLWLSLEKWKPRTA